MLHIVGADRRRYSQSAIRPYINKRRYLRTIYKPHSVQWTPLRDSPPVRSSLWATRYHVARCSLPGTSMKTSSLPSSEDEFVPAWPCSRRGLPSHPHYCGCWWPLTPPFHHHPGVKPGLFVSVALIRQVSPPRMLSDAMLFGVRTFLDPKRTGPRSPNRPEATS